MTEKSEIERKGSHRTKARKEQEKKRAPVVSRGVVWGITRRGFLKTALGAAIAAAAIYGGKRALDYFRDARFLDRLRDYERSIDVPVFNLSLEQQEAVKSEGWFEEVPPGLPDDYKSLSLESQFKAIQEATIKAQNELGNKMIRSASPYFVDWAQTLNDNFSLVESPIPKDGSIVLKVGPFRADLTEEGVAYDIFFGTDAASDHWYVRISANTGLFNPATRENFPPSFSTWATRVFGLGHEMYHYYFAKGTVDFLKKEGMATTEAVDFLRKGDPMQEPFAHWHTAEAFHKTFGVIKDTDLVAPSLLEDVSGYLRIKETGGKWFDESWTSFIERRYPLRETFGPSHARV